MRSILALLIVSALSSTAFAGQTIRCNQINKDGSLRSHGITLKLEMSSRKSGSAEATGFRKVFDAKFEVLSVDQGTAIDGSKYTTLFLVPEIDDEMVDIQLQFDSIVIGKNFSNEKASFVIGSEDANPETSFAFGYDMVCSGRVK